MINPWNRNFVPRWLLRPGGVVPLHTYQGLLTHLATLTRNDLRCGTNGPTVPTLAEPTPVQRPRVPTHRRTHPHHPQLTQTGPPSTEHTSPHDLKPQLKDTFRRPNCRNFGLAEHP